MASSKGAVENEWGQSSTSIRVTETLLKNLAGGQNQ